MGKQAFDYEVFHLPDVDGRFVFAVLLLWGVWAMRTAYVGWAEHRITERQFLAVVVRFVAMYLVLTFFLLS